MQRLMDETYKQFVSKAALGRKMKFDDLEKLAGGRVYTGRQALKLGLVDELGTLPQAIAAAKALGGISADDKGEMLILPKAQGVLESLIGPMEDRDASIRLELSALGLDGFLPDAVRTALAKVHTLTRLMAREPAAVVMPFDLSIR